MSIFEAMERLAGAALLALAPAAGVAVPAQHRSRSMDLVAMLRTRGGGDLVDGYVGELTREIWVGAEAIATVVANELVYRLVVEEILKIAAERRNLSPAVVAVSCMMRMKSATVKCPRKT